MPNMLSVYINGEKVLDYDKSARQPGKIRQHLEGMDVDMDEGIELNEKHVSNPNKIQRAQYVAMSLLYGIQFKSDGMISATCAYLANRNPEIKQIRSIETGDEVTLDLIYNEVN